jgi:hypothetical protein
LKIFIKITVALLLVIALSALGIWYRVSSLGQEALLDIANQANLCKTDACPEGVEEAASYLAEEFGLSPRLVEWCVGVDTLAEHDGGKGLTNRSWWINLLYRPCGDPVVE